VVAEDDAGQNRGGHRSDSSDGDRVPTKWAIDRLDPRERRYSFVSAAVAVLFGILVYSTETSNRHFRLAKNQLTPQSTLVVGLVAGALLVATAYLGRRAPVGFVALFTGAAFGGSSLVLGLPFFVLAIWLLYRSYKTQREAASTLRAAGPRTRERPSKDRSSPAPAARGASGRGAAGKKPSPPTPNKRYTPKRPAPPPPKPSRRARRGAGPDE
jgi:hypothetical protein